MKRTDSKRQNGDLETIAFRLTRREIQLIHAGLKPAVCAWAQGKEFGKFPYTDFLRVYPHLQLQHGEFDQRFMDFVLAAWATCVAWLTDKKAKSHRVRLDPIIIAILHFFARIAYRQIRHGHATSPVPNSKQTMEKLSRKLENRRRQALRKTKAFGNGCAYAKLAKQWHQFQLWMRSNLLYCRCHRRSRGSNWRLQQMQIAECEKAARKAIEKEGLRMPEPKELRGLVRIAIRYSRRGRGAALRTLCRGDDVSVSIWRRFFNQRLVPLSDVSEGGRYEEK